MTATPLKTPVAKPTVFIIDDDEAVLKSLRLILSREYTVHTETRPQTAVEAIRKLLPDVVVVDLKMPIRDGFWTFSEIRKFDQEVPIIINSAYQDIVPPEDLKEAFRPFASLQKGGSLATFVNIIKKAAAYQIAMRLKSG